MMSENNNNNNNDDDSHVAVETPPPPPPTTTTSCVVTVEDDDCTSTAPDNSSSEFLTNSSESDHVKSIISNSSKSDDDDDGVEELAVEKRSSEYAADDDAGTTTEKHKRSSWSSRAAEYAVDDDAGTTTEKQKRSSCSSRAAEYAAEDVETKGTGLGSARAAAYAIEGATDLKESASLAAVPVTVAGGNSTTDLEISSPEDTTDLENPPTTPPTRPESMPGAYRRSSRNDSFLPPEEVHYHPTTNEEAPASRRGGDDLVEALPLEEGPDAPDLMEANVVNQRDLDEQAERAKARNQKRKLIACVLAVVVLLFVVVWPLIVVFVLNKDNAESSSGDDDDMMAAGKNETSTATDSPTKPLPPMENLELLYHELPDKSKESLYDMESPQFKAWDWLLNHPNLTGFEEWRKRQIFALTTFFYSFEGPNWPEQTRSRWLNTSTSECSWVLTDAEVGFWAQISTDNFGPDYSYEDFQPCNQDGELQTIVMSQLFLPVNVTPSIPPEMGMLTSLQILMIFFSQFNAKFSDLLVPEVAKLPNLSFLNLQSNGMSGTMPKEMELMTGLRHFLIGGNNLADTIPTEVGKMTSLEHFITSGMEGIVGTVPTQLGLLTRLTELCLESLSLTNVLPSELGLLTNVQKLWLGNNPEEGGTNKFVGSIPKELFLELSNIQELHLPNLQRLSGSLPTEMMPNMTLLRLEGSPHLSATIPDEICYLQEESPPSDFLPGQALDFDCSDLLCGCDCECVIGSGSDAANETNPADW